jgi:SAM-dependent methyltransferase
VTDDAGFDLVLQSYGELGTLDAATLATVLATIRRALRPGGALVFDVTTPAAPAPRPGNRWALTQGGLWRPGEYVLLTDHLDCPENLGCDRYVVIDDHVTTYRMWKRAYTPATIRDSLARAGR